MNKRDYRNAARLASLSPAELDDFKSGMTAEAERIAARRAAKGLPPVIDNGPPLEDLLADLVGGFGRRSSASPRPARTGAASR